MPLNNPPLLLSLEYDLSPSLLPVKSEILLDGPPVRSVTPPVLPPVSSDAPWVFAGAEVSGPATGDRLFKLCRIVKEVWSNLQQPTAYVSGHWLSCRRSPVPCIARLCSSALETTDCLIYFDVGIGHPTVSQGSQISACRHFNRLV